MAEPQEPAVILLAAVAHDRVIGAGNRLPWRLPEDLRRFKATTMGHPMVMGRRTFDSLGGKPLPGRPHVVVSRQPGLAARVPAGVRVAASPEESLAMARALAPAGAPNPVVFVIGGGELYAALLPRATEALLTLVDLRVAGDARFPCLGPGWHLAALEPPATSAGGLRFALARLLRGDPRPDGCALCALRAGRGAALDPGLGGVLAALAEEAPS